MGIGNIQCYNGVTALRWDTTAASATFSNFGPLQVGQFIRQIIVHTLDGGQGADSSFISAAMCNGSPSSKAEFDAGQRIFGVGSVGVDLSFPGAGTEATHGPRVGLVVPINRIVIAPFFTLCVLINRGNVDGILGVVCVDIPPLLEGRVIG